MEPESKPLKRQITLSPWLVTGAALALYLITLNHWVRLNSLPIIAQVTGWDWHPGFLDWRPKLITPLFFLLTLPFRALPAGWQPIGLNVFSAVCAAATLGLLARSVRLLPHDRTRDQCQREHGAFALLSVRHAWLPVLLAVLVCGLEMSFWENATAATGETLDLLIFASLIWCLLEFRVSQKDCWLYLFTFVYGLGTTNNWALIGFFPCFLVALVWILGMRFFNWRLLARLSLWGVAGLLLYLLVPLMGVFSGSDTFWHLLRAHLRAQEFMLLLIPRWAVLFLALPTLVALFFAGIRWMAFQGDLSPSGAAINNFLLRVIHFVFFGFSLWMFLDLKYSPRGLEPRVPLLSYYYLGALSVGYYAGYLLLVFGELPMVPWVRIGKISRAGGLVVVGALWLMVAGAAVGLPMLNLPKIQAANSSALRDYANEMVKALPSDKSTLVLSDDSSQLYLLQAAAQRLGTGRGLIPMETASMPYAEYLYYLAGHYPAISQVMTNRSDLPEVIPAQGDVFLVSKLSLNNSVYYLHPSYGYYFEQFYLSPHGVVYELKLRPPGIAQTPDPSPAQLGENEEFWSRLKAGPLAVLPELAARHNDAMAVAGLYARALDCWGVTLQRARRLPEAEAQFEAALQLNTNNVMAEINRLNNANLQRGNTGVVDTAKLLDKAAQIYGGSWVPALNTDGPVDEAELDLAIGAALQQGGNIHQAGDYLLRRLELRPGDFDAQLGLVNAYTAIGQPEIALQKVRALHPAEAAAQTELARAEAMAWLAATNFAAGEKVLLEAQRALPHDDGRVLALIVYYTVSGNMAAQAGDAKASQDRWAKAIDMIDEDQRLSRDPGHRAASPSAAIELLFKKAELEIYLKRFDAATNTLTKVLQSSADPNPAALFNRAIAQYQAGKYDGARKDYLQVQKVEPRYAPYAVHYGLGEIARLQTNAAEAISEFRLYLKTAPTNTGEYELVRSNLNTLESRH